MGEISKFTQRRLNRLNDQKQEFIRLIDLGILPMYGNVYKIQVLAEQVVKETI